MARFLVLFAREPRREAREKGFASAGAVDLFAAFAAGWQEAAQSAGARMLVMTPPEDLSGWRRAFPRGLDLLWAPQKGCFFGARLEDAVLRAAGLGGPALLVGGDVAPSASLLRAAFEALEEGADAVLAPSPDGGVSLLSTSAADADLFREVGRRNPQVFQWLENRLRSRGRRVTVIAEAPDVDGRLSLRGLQGIATLSLFAPLLRRALQRPAFLQDDPPHFVPPGPRMSPEILRGPPLAG
jgi:glycosyltransferase A (GT-A) superfamily protein (DUF2064 family)